MIRLLCLLSLCAGFVAAPLRAEVQDATAAGFTSLNTAAVDAPVARVFFAFLEITRWWHPDHTYWGDAANLYLEPRVGGFFGERQRTQYNSPGLHFCLFFVRRALRKSTRT